MTTTELYQLRFPVGEFECPKIIDSTQVKAWVQTIADFPTQVEALTKDLNKEQLNWKYRPDGWAIKQVVHHCVDSHMNSLIRFKLALTEEKPAIRPYHEDRWAELTDALEEDLEASMLILKGLHRKWTQLLRALSAGDLKRTFVHPEHGKSFVLDENIGVYAWHCEHHLAHIRLSLEAKGIYN